LVSKTNLIAERKREMEPKALEKLLQDAIKRDIELSYREGVRRALVHSIALVNALIAKNVWNADQKEELRGMKDALTDELSAQIESPHPSPDKSDQRIAP
jgi:hypothetical protein